MNDSSQHGRGVVRTPLAVIGYDCLLPGADGPDQFWDLLEAGRCAVGEFPADRLDRDLYFDPEQGVLGKTYSTVGGFVPEPRVPRPTPAVCGDEQLDPAHRLTARVAAAAIQHAGYTPGDLPDAGPGRANCGVYVGHSGGTSAATDLTLSSLAEQVADLLRDVDDPALPPADHDALVAEFTAAIRAGRPARDDTGGPFLEANRVASTVAAGIGADGPHVAIDAACASSLVALALGALAVQDGRCGMAVVAGASYNKLESMILFSQARSCTATGTRPFDADADGLASSEGYVALVIKPLADALRDGDAVRGVIRGVGISSDGRGRSLWAPRAGGQEKAVRRAYADDDDLRGVQVVEAHATSTKVGDATELEALTGVFGPLGLPGEERRKLPIASVKSNVGHTLEAAGLAGLLKMLLAMDRGVIPPSANFRTPSPNVDWEAAPFDVVTAARPWARPAKDGNGNANGGERPRRAAVNAFGIGGINVHVAVDEFLPANPPSVPAKPRAAAPEPVAVVGRGLVLPSAVSVNQFADLLEAGRPVLSHAPASRWRDRVGLAQGEVRPGVAPSDRGGFVGPEFDYDWTRHKIPPKQIERGNPLQFMLLDAGTQAIAESANRFDPDRTAVVIGSVFGGEFGDQLAVGLRLVELRKLLGDVLAGRGTDGVSLERIVDAYQTVLLEANTALEDETGSFTCSTLASRVARTFDLSGGSMALDAGDCSGLSALTAAADLLRCGSVDAVLCGAAHRGGDLPAFEALGLRGIWDPDIPGAVPGEGAVVFLLRRLSDATRDGEKIFAVLGGDGAASAKSLPDAAATAAARAVGATPGRIAPSLSAPRPADRDAERTALSRVMAGDAVPSPVAPLIGRAGPVDALASLAHATLRRPGSTVALAAADLNGLVHAQAVAVPAADGTVPPLPVPARFAPPAASKKTAPEAARPRSARPQPVRKMPRPMPARTVPAPILNGRHPAPTAVRVDDTSGVWAAAAESLDDLRDVVTRGRSGGAGRYRAVAVANGAGSPDDAREALSAHLAGGGAVPAFSMNWGVTDTHGERPRVAFLLPGQGSRADGLDRLAAESPAAANFLADADDRLEAAGGPTLAELADGIREDGDAAAKVWRSQAGCLVADLAWRAAAAERGLRADVWAGHSFGEYAALVAGGVCDLPAALRMARSRADAVRGAALGETGLLAVDAPAADVADLIAEGRHTVALTHRNAPRQTVVGGSAGALDRFGATLAEKGVTAHRLSVPAAFHTPLLAPAAARLRAALAGERLHPPAAAILSNVSLRYVAEPDDLRDSLAAQLTEPVRWTELVGRLHDDGVRLFVEVGPGRVLTGLTRATLAAAAPPADAGLCLSCDGPARETPADRLDRIAAVLRGLGLIDERPAPRPVLEENAAAKRSAASPAPSRIAAPPADDFDATAHRREKNRRAARGKVEHTNGHAVTRLSKSPAAPAAETRELETRVTNDDDGDALAALLVDFIVDQTGYPPEAIELDADLEADLGLDSIKKAQLVGEVKGHLDGTVDLKSLSLAEVRSINDILALANVGQASRLPAAAPAAVHEVKPRATENSDALAALLVDFIVDQTGYPPEAIELDADLEADLGLDSIKKAQLVGEVKGHLDGTVDLKSLSLAEVRSINDILALAGPSVTRLSKSPAAAPAAETRESETRVTDDDGDALAALLVDFIIDQTGYPAEAIELDADLEADLGLDSIKKAQLVGEVKGHLEGTVDLKKVSLAELRSINDILALAGVGQASRLPAAAQPAERDKPEACPTPLTAADLPPGRYGWGVEFGSRHAGTIRNRLTDHADRLEPAVVADGGGLFADEELAGIAAGVGVHVGNVSAHERFLAELAGRGGAGGSHRSNGNGRGPHGGGPNGHSPNDHRPAADRTSGHPSGDQPADDGPFRTTAEPREEADAARVARRFVLRTVPDGAAGLKPDRSGLQPEWHGDALLLGDNPVAAVLAERLRKQGVTPHVVAVRRDAAETVAAVERACAGGPCPHLFLLTAHDAGAAVASDDAAGLAERRDRGLWSVFEAGKRWYELTRGANAVGGCTLAAAVGLGGDFGFTGPVSATDGGFASGLLKAVSIENWVRGDRFTPLALVDSAPGTDPGEVADALLDELADPSYEVETARRGGRRYVVRATPQAVPDRGERQVPTGGAWVCTGGGRGITALVAQKLAERYGLSLHLLGTAPPPDIPDGWRDLHRTNKRTLREEVTLTARKAGENSFKRWQKVEKAMEIADTLDAMREAGVDATYHECDVSDRAELDAVLQDIRRAGGPIRGVLHGAGVGKDCRYEDKEPDEVRKCFGAKPIAADHLTELTAADPLEAFVAFGSISGRFGANGHTDYSPANELLAKQVGRLRAERPDVAAVAFHWHAWDGAGMAMKPSTRQGLEMIALDLMPADEGVARVIAELDAGAPEAEVLVTTEKHWRSFGGGGAAAGERAAGRPLDPTPLFDRDGSGDVNTPTADFFAVTLHPGRDPFLAQHRVNDRPLLPFVVGMELLCEGYRARTGDRPRVLRDCRVPHGLAFHTDDAKTLRVRVGEDGPDGREIELLGDFRTRAGKLLERDRLFAAATVSGGGEERPGCSAASGTPGDANVDFSDWRRAEYPAAGGYFYSGPALQCLRRVRSAGDLLEGKIVAVAPDELFAPHRPVGDWHVPCAVLDACLFAAGLLAWERVKPASALPVSIDTLTLARMPAPGEHCTVRVAVRASDAAGVRFDFALLGRDGSVVLRADGYRVAFAGS